MPEIYLSPSTQQGNLYINIGTEEEWMNRLADLITPYLIASGIRYTRNTPEMTAATSIEASNRGIYDLHLALHSNAMPEEKAGTQRGIICFYYPESKLGYHACDLTTIGLKVIYPLPNEVVTRPTTTIGEVRLVYAPSAYLEIGYHDNLEDALWIQDNLEKIAYVIALSVAEFLEVPFLTPVPLIEGEVDTNVGNLNLRDRPTTSSRVLATIPKGEKITIVNSYKDWYVAYVDDLLGWVNQEYIHII